MSSISTEECTDNKPSDYDASAASYCPWTCKDWADFGKCDRKWNVWRCSGSSEKIKDTCKASCNICGKYAVYFQNRPAIKSYFLGNS